MNTPLPTDPTSRDQYIVVGRIGAKYGVRGWQKLTSFTTPPENILSYNKLFVKKHNQWHLLPQYELTQQSNNFLIRIDHCETPEQAQQYTGLEIAIIKQDLPPLNSNEYYWAELEGMRVYHLSGEFFGTVDYLFEAGANDILVVKGKRKRMIPFVQGSPIVSVDRDEKKIIVDWDPSI